MTVADVLASLEKIAPSQFALPGDRIGLQVGSAGAPVTKVVLALDRSLGAVRFAADKGAEMLICHHPLIWEPVKTVREDDHVGRTISELIRNGIAFAAAHTNWDAAPGGVNDTLAELLGLQDVRPFGESNRVPRLQLVTFVPEAALQKVIDAVSSAGAGVIGLYRRCAFYSPGTGTFVPQEGADPTIGSVGQVEEAEEARLEMVVPETRADAVSEALLAAHPYDEPAFHLHQLHSKNDQPIGRIGRLASPLSLDSFLTTLDSLLATRCLAWGDSGRNIANVAVVGGAAADEWRSAQGEGADVLVTGEVPQHVALEVAESGFAIVAAGHYATENPGVGALCDRLRTALPGLEFFHYEPTVGTSGRPL